MSDSPLIFPPDGFGMSVDWVTAAVHGFIESLDRSVLGDYAVSDDELFAAVVCRVQHHS